MDKEQLIKLAEIAGYECQLRTYSDGAVELSIPDSSNPFAGRGSKNWRPQNDIAQAFEVLTGFDNVFLSKSNIRNNVSWEVEIWDIGLENKLFLIVSDSLPEAICNAVLKAVDYE